METIKNSKNVFFHILTAVKTRNLPGKWIFFDLVFAGRPERQQYTFWTWDDTTHGHRFSKKCQKPHFLGLLADFLKIRSFRGKSGRVTFLTFWSCNFMPKTRKIVRAVFQNFESLLTDPHRNSSTGAEAQLPLRTVIYSHSLKNEYFLTRFSQKNRKNYKFHYFVLKRSFPVTNFLGNSKNLLFYHF